MEVPFSDFKTIDIILHNKGVVTFDFEIDLSSIQRKGLVELNVLNGLVAGGDKQKISIKLCPGIPDDINEVFYI